MEARSTNVVRINDEMKNMFSQSAKSMIATAQNNMIIHVNPENSSQPTQQQQQQQTAIGQPDLNNVNFNNAVFKKNMLSSAGQTTTVSTTVPPSMTAAAAVAMVDPTVEHSASMTFSDAYLMSDDLAQLQVVDDKSLVDSIKAKFEIKKYYVI